MQARILTLRGQRVMINADLAQLFGVPTRALNQAIKRNAARFPQDFMFQLDAQEKAEVIANCDHLQKLKFSKALPFAFTEHGAIQAANVLASAQAVEIRPSGRSASSSIRKERTGPPARTQGREATLGRKAGRNGWWIGVSS